MDRIEMKNKINKGDSLNFGLKINKYLTNKINDAIRQVFKESKPCVIGKAIKNGIERIKNSTPSSSGTSSK